jgi:hypothetical protein
MAASFPEKVQARETYRFTIIHAGSIVDFPNNNKKKITMATTLSVSSEGEFWSWNQTILIIIRRFLEDSETRLQPPESTSTDR